MDAFEHFLLSYSLAKTSSPMLNRGDQKGNAFLFLDLKLKVFMLSPLHMTLAMALS